MSIDLTSSDYIEFRSSIRENPGEFVVITGTMMALPSHIPNIENIRDTLIICARSLVDDVVINERKDYEKMVERIAANSNIWEAFSDLASILPRKIYSEIIEKELSIKDIEKYSNNYDLLWELQPHGIINFNLDQLPIYSYEKVNKKPVDCATANHVERYPQFLSGKHNFVFQPHGISTDNRTWVLTENEIQQLNNDTTYTNFIKSLIDTKNLFLIGFNTSDFIFNYIIEKVIDLSPLVEKRHYCLLPMTESKVIEKLDKKGFRSICYIPNDHANHSEIEIALKDMLSFIPIDSLESSVYVGEEITPNELPPIKTMLSMNINELRYILNGAISYIIPPNSTPDADDINNLQEFYKKNLAAINHAWLIEPESEWDELYNYKISRRIGRGAFGQVYEAIHPDTNERLAVKLLLPEIRSDSEYLNSFRRGVKSMKILSRRQVSGMVKFVDAYEIPACVFMDFIEGPTLRQAIEDNLLTSFEKSIDILVKIAKIVRNAHSLDERVLHRDLKPDNIILKDGWDPNEISEVIVLDFDLSWHKGASDMSVVHGARAQGYAAPEQTATGRNPKYSTRKTAVDCFGLGMLIYYVLTGNDPRPNEQNFPGFKDRIVTSIQNRFNTSWKCMPISIAQLIEDCTKDNQPKRRNFSAATELLQNLYDMSFMDRIDVTNPMILNELAVILDPSAKFESDEFGRHLIVQPMDSSKKIELKLQSRNKRVELLVELRKVRSDFDHRNVAKYIETAKNKVGSLVIRVAMQTSNILLNPA